MDKKELMELIQEYGELMYELRDVNFSNTPREQELKNEIAALLQVIENNL